MSLEVVVLPAGGTNVAHVEVRTSSGITLASLEVRDVLDNITVRASVLEDAYVVKKHLSDFEE